MAWNPWTLNLTASRSMTCPGRRSGRNRSSTLAYGLGVPCLFQQGKPWLVMTARAGQSLGRGRMWPEQVHGIILWKDTRRTAGGSGSARSRCHGTSWLYFGHGENPHHAAGSRESGIVSHWCDQLAFSNLLMNRAQK